MKETIEDRIKRIMSTPVDKNAKHVFRYYFDDREADNPALYVALEGGGLYSYPRTTRTWVAWRKNNARYFSKTQN